MRNRSKVHIANNARCQRAQAGFTLIELLVVIGVVAILLAITIIAINPSQHFQGARNAQRQSDVTTILDAVYQYEAANSGNLPAALVSLGTTATALSKAGIDLCTLTPTYLADIPLDPSGGTKTGGTSTCTATTYVTGYTIAKSATGNRFTVAAPSAENGATISVTR